MCVARHAQISQSNKFAISLQYLTTEVGDKVDFLQADKHQSWFWHFGHQSFVQGDTIIVDGHDQAFSNYSK